MYKSQLEDLINREKHTWIENIYISVLLFFLNTQIK